MRSPGIRSTPIAFGSLIAYGSLIAFGALLATSTSTAAWGHTGAPPASAATAAGHPTRIARAARALGVRDEGRLRFLSSSGPQLTDEGPVSGTLPGRVRVRFTYNGNPVVLAQFTIYSAGGSISGRAQGRLHDATTLTPSFRGSLSITGGSGRYAHVHGGGELFGVYYRHGYGLLVQTVAELRY